MAKAETGYVSWFNKLMAWALKGINVSGSIHKLSPVKSSTGKGWKMCDCPKCKTHNAFVFRSHTDGKVYVAFCRKCKKYTARNSEVESSTCKGTKADGTACTYKAKDDGYCGIHTP